MDQKKNNDRDMINNLKEDKIEIKPNKENDSERRKLSDLSPLQTEKDCNYLLNFK